MNIKIGFGFDVHQLKENSPFYLGGIKIPHQKGAIGHSDADVLIHAICDALLGAANQRDIGHHFPNTDPKLKGIDSKILLKKVVEIVSNCKFKIGNIDATICLEKPKINSYIDEMKKVLSQTLSVSVEDISIKATTTEKLGYIGKEKGVSAYAVVLIEKVG